MIKLSTAKTGLTNAGDKNMNQDTTDIGNKLTRKHRIGAGINREKRMREVEAGLGNNQSVQHAVSKNPNKT